MPEGAVYVGRPSRWGNPWRIGDIWCLHRLTAYDAAYLQVAVARGLPLATLDATLAEAARAAGVTLLA